MPARKLSGRELRRKISNLLKTRKIDQALDVLCRLPARQAVNPLFSFLLSTDPHLKWSAVTALGAVIAKLANQEMEPARIIMRRLMWQLNDESGGIGWGCPEAMGEAMACHEGLAQEYAGVLASYIMEDGNFLEYEPLQEGAVWGIGRVAQVRPKMVQESIPHLLPFLASGRATLRGFAVWALGLLGSRDARSHINLLLTDRAQIELYRDRTLKVYRVMNLSEEALVKIEEKK